MALYLVAPGEAAIHAASSATPQRWAASLQSVRRILGIAETENEEGGNAGNGGERVFRSFFVIRAMIRQRQYMDRVMKVQQEGSKRTEKMVALQQESTELLREILEAVSNRPPAN